MAGNIARTTLGYVLGEEKKFSRVPKTFGCKGSRRSLEIQYIQMFGNKTQTNVDTQACLDSHSCVVSPRRTLSEQGEVEQGLS